MRLLILMTGTALTVSGLILSAAAQPHDHAVSASTAAASEHAGHAMPQPDPHAGHQMAAMPMRGTLGHYPMSRDASGTGWQPDDAAHGGIHAQAGDWNLMGHLSLSGVYSNQSGARGAI